MLLFELKSDKEPPVIAAAVTLFTALPSPAKSDVVFVYSAISINDAVKNTAKNPADR